MTDPLFPEPMLSGKRFRAMSHVHILNEGAVATVGKEQSLTNDHLVPLFSALLD